MIRLFLFAASTLILNAQTNHEPEVQALWPGAIPEEAEQKMMAPGAIKTTEAPVAGKPITIIHQVTQPKITIYRPDPAKDTGAAVLVCPGGGYYVLAIDIEGTEICEWLNSVGVTAVLLEYRVPRLPGRPPYAAPLQDAQRALGLMRSRATELGLDPHRIGVLGFSAGGHLAAVLSNHEQRSYSAVDAIDNVSCRPDFCLLIYPAYLTGEPPGPTLAHEVAAIPGRTPQTFIAMTEDDGVGVEGAMQYYGALHQAGIPAEMHLYPRGGHGYGLRRTEAIVTTWPDRAAAWLKAEGILAARP